MTKKNKKFEPKVIADERVEFEGGEPEGFTNFEELLKRVDVLQEMIELHADILNQNNLKKTEITEADGFDIDDVYKKLEAEE